MKSLAWLMAAVCLVACTGQIGDVDDTSSLAHQNVQTAPNRGLPELPTRPSIGLPGWPGETHQGTGGGGEATGDDAGTVGDAGTGGGTGTGGGSVGTGGGTTGTGGGTTGTGGGTTGTGGGTTGTGGGTASGGAPTCMRIMPLGDSITLGVNGGYRNQLWTDLTGQTCGVNYVGSQSDQYCKAPDHDHEGHPGFTIGDISSNVDAWLASAQPDYILLMIGTNDIAWWSAETAQQIGARHLALMDQIMADRPNATLVVASIPPITSSIIAPNNVDRAQLGRDLNVQIQANVAARAAQGKAVHFADVYSVLTTADLYDGVHPTEAAHARVGDVWFNALAPLVSCSAPAPACGP